MKTTTTICSMIAVLLSAMCRPARADMASPGLSKYEKPVDEAIDRALKFIAAQQDAVGRNNQRRIDPKLIGRINGGKGGSTAITGLGVMAFLAKGHKPGYGPYGEVINRGIDFVLNSQRDNGLLIAEEQASGPMYSHGISTLMLSEVSGMVDAERQKRIDVALPKALKVILGAQQSRKDLPKDDGGWRYQANSTDADLSCSGWQLMALRAAKQNGAPVPKQSIEKAIQYVMRCQTKEGGFAYQSGEKPGLAGGPGLGRTGMALLTMELCGMHGQKIALDAGDWVLKSITTKDGTRDYQLDSHFHYATYYVSQGMFQLGGRYWEQWAEVMYPKLLSMQKADGSFSGDENYGVTYGTSMAVLSMSVIYRQLPIYQR